MLSFAITVVIDGDVELWFGNCVPCFMVSELIKRKSISIFMVELFRILFVGGDIVVPFPKVLAAALWLFYCAYWFHFAKRFRFVGLQLNCGPICFESIFIDLAFLLLAWTAFMVKAGGVIEKYSGLLAGHCLIGRLLEEVFFFHCFYNFYWNTQRTSKYL